MSLASPAPEADGRGPSTSADSAPREATRSLWREYFESIVVTAVMALFFMTFVGQAATVPTGSMQNTILVGDHFLINKFIFAPGPHPPFLPQRDIRRGDIIVFKYPSQIGTSSEIVQYKTFFIKRVIGLPGDVVEVRGADILINGRVLPEHRVAAEMGEVNNRRDDRAPLAILHEPSRADPKPYTVYYHPETLHLSDGTDETAASSKSFGVGRPFDVPENHYFVMGDNRDNSSDSRRWGTVPRHLVVGRALFIIWSYDESAPSSGNFLIDFFRNTRWKRTGTLIR